MQGQPVARTFRSGVDFEQLGFFRRVCDRDIALVRSDELVGEITKSAVQSLATDSHELRFVSDFLGGSNPHFSVPFEKCARSADIGRG
jgi:hypothetical protein